MPVLRVGGGLVIARIGLGMLDSEQKAPPTDLESDVASKLDVALTPVAMPMLSGPGSIALTIAMATEATGMLSYTAIAGGILLVALVAWITLHFSASVVRFIGDSGMHALTRIMGLLLVCIGIQFVATGMIEGLTSAEMTAVLRDWLDALQTND